MARNGSIRCARVQVIVRSKSKLRPLPASRFSKSGCASHFISKKHSTEFRGSPDSEAIAYLLDNFDYRPKERATVLKKYS